MIEPLRDRVLIQRVEDESGLLLTDRQKGIKGIVLAVGPGKWVDGTWWYVTKREQSFDWTTRSITIRSYKEWEWQDGYYQKPEVKPGMKVLFNSKWNDFSAGENKGTGSDFSGPLERPLPLGADPKLHLVQEADIFCIVDHFDFHAALKPESNPFTQNIEIKGPWNS